MYCRECGNKLFESDKFCSNCGIKINKNFLEINKQMNISSDKVVSEKNNILPMNWYNFFTYFRLPLGIVLNTYTLFTYNYSSFVYNKIELGIFFINIALIILLVLSFYMLHKRMKNTMTCIIILLLVECLSIIGNCINSFNVLTYIVITFITFVIWFIPNYIYFKKREDIFIN